MQWTAWAFYLCSGLGSAEQISYDVDYYLFSITKLPSDCRWLDEEDSGQRRIVQSEVIVQVKHPVHGLIDVSYVCINKGYCGYSSGLAPRIG